MLKNNKKHVNIISKNKKKLYRKLKEDLGPLAYNSWKMKLKNSGINIKNMKL